MPALRSTLALILPLITVLPLIIAMTARAEPGAGGAVLALPIPAAPSPVIPPAPARPGRGAAILAFRTMARAEALKAGLPFDLVDAVMKIESDYSPARVGDVGELGLMQVRPGTAAMLGFHGAPGELSSPALNIHYGTLYLGQAWHLTKGDVCRTLMKYRAGHGQEVMSALSTTYCARARAHLVAINSPLAALVKPSDLVAMAAVDPPTTQAAMPTGTATPSLRHKVGPAFWSVFQARIKAANARIESKWRRVAAR